MVYLDTAALVKLVRREVASDALVDWIGDHPDELLVSSTLAEVELPRALRRTEPALLAAVPALLGRIAVYEIDDLVRATAAAYDDPLARRDPPRHSGRRTG
jgi:predicted nucleic acid-binding protein